MSLLVSGISATISHSMETKIFAKRYDDVV